MNIFFKCTLDLQTSHQNFEGKKTRRHMHGQLDTQKCIRRSRIKVILLENFYNLSFFWWHRKALLLFSYFLIFLQVLLIKINFFKVSQDYFFYKFINFVFNQIPVMDYSPSMHAYYDYMNAQKGYLDIFCMGRQFWRRHVLV